MIRKGESRMMPSRTEDPPTPLVPVRFHSAHTAIIAAPMAIAGNPVPSEGNRHPRYKTKSVG